MGFIDITKRSPRTMRAGLCSFTFVLGVILILAAGTLPALAEAPLFQPAVNYEVGSSPKSVAVGDFNGDGKPDLAAANFGGGRVSVLLNNTHTLTTLALTDTIPDLTAGGSVYDLDSLSLTGQNQLGQTISIAGLPVTWACSDTTGSILNGHYLEPLSAGDGGAVTATADGITSNSVSFNVLPAVNTPTSAPLP